jgi:hypothetical protein
MLEYSAVAYQWPEHVYSAVPIQRPEYFALAHLVASILSFLSARWAEEKLRQSGSGPSSSSNSNWNRKERLFESRSMGK